MKIQSIFFGEPKSLLRFRNGFGRRKSQRRAVQMAVFLLAWASFMPIGLAWAAEPTYPHRPIRIISPFAAGGGTDFLARLLSTKLSVAIGQPVVVDNRPGANGLIGAEVVARAAPDGYTLLLGTVGTHGINAAMYAKVPYDTLRDFSPIAMIARTPMLVLAHPKIQANSIQELAAEIRQSNVPFFYSSAGVGSVGHVTGELFAKTTGLPLIHAPYKGGAPAVADLLAGQVQLMFGTPASTAQYVSAGKIKVLGVTSAHRSKIVPNIPTLSEQGFAGFDVGTWYGLIAPAKTPPAIVNLLASKVGEFLQSPDVQRQMQEQGFETIGNTPAEFEAQIRGEVTKWSQIQLKK